MKIVSSKFMKNTIRKLRMNKSMIEKNKWMNNLEEM